MQRKPVSPAPPAAARKGLAIGVALAACAFALPDLGDSDTIELQVTPAGAFRPSDGRPMEVDAWRIDAAVAARVIDRFKARKTPPVIDWEHQTLYKEANGQPAPAAAWMRELHWREDRGLFATVELAGRAREWIGSKEYRFFSPVFTYHRESGEVLEIQMGAFTNNPAIDGMEPLSLRAAATFGIASLPTTTAKDPRLNPLLTAVLTALGLGANTTEEQAIAALSAFKPGDTLADVRRALNLDAQADTAAVVAACTRLQANQADPAKFVPVAALTQVQTELAALTTKLRDGEVGQLVDDALADGRLLAGEQEKWARDLGKTNLAALTAFLKTAQPIAALSGTQTRGKAPPGATSAATSDAQAVASAAVKYQTEQAAVGNNVSTVDAVAHVYRTRGA